MLAYLSGWERLMLLKKFEELLLAAMLQLKALLGGEAFLNQGRTKKQKAALDRGEEMKGVEEGGCRGNLGMKRAKEMRGSF